MGWKRPKGKMQCVHERIAVVLPCVMSNRGVTGARYFLIVTAQQALWNVNIGLGLS